MAHRQPCIYILASGRNGTIYVGVISDLARRVGRHRLGNHDSFSARYHIKSLVNFEMHHSMEEAILREKRIKKWNRVWKLRLIETANPGWHDLFEMICR